MTHSARCGVCDGPLHPLSECPEWNGLPIDDVVEQTDDDSADFSWAAEDDGPIHGYDY